MSCALIPPWSKKQTDRYFVPSCIICAFHHLAPTLHMIVAPKRTPYSFVDRCGLLHAHSLLSVHCSFSFIQLSIEVTLFVNNMRTNKFIEVISRFDMMSFKVHVIIIYFYIPMYIFIYLFSWVKHESLFSHHEHM